MCQYYTKSQLCSDCAVAASTLITQRNNSVKRSCSLLCYVGVRPPRHMTSGGQWRPKTWLNFRCWIRLPWKSAGCVVDQGVWIKMKVKHCLFIAVSDLAWTQPQCQCCVLAPFFFFLQYAEWTTCTVCSGSGWNNFFPCVHIDINPFILFRKISYLLSLCNYSAVFVKTTNWHLLWRRSQ